MADALNQLKGDARLQYINTTLIAAKATLNPKSNFGLDDLQTLSNLPMYIENLYVRLDINSNGQLEFSEAMTGFPIFCNELKKASRGFFQESCKPEWAKPKLEALYGYLLINGEPPRGIKPGDSIVTKARQGKIWYSWLRFWQNLYRDPATRDLYPPFIQRFDLMAILANLSLVNQPETITETVAETTLELTSEDWPVH
jgi:hypothetical protein